MSSCPEVTATVGQYSCQEPLCPQQTPYHNAACMQGLRGLGRACKSELFIRGGSHHGGRKVIVWSHGPGNHSEGCAGTLQGGNEMSWCRVARPDDMPHTVTTLFLRPRAIQCMSQGRSPIAQGDRGLFSLRLVTSLCIPRLWAALGKNLFRQSLTILGK